jgi:GTP-binding protein
MLDKHRVLAITKCDLLDEELIGMLREELSGLSVMSGKSDESVKRSSGTPIVFISAVTGYGLEELKDVLWAELNAESNKLAAVMAEDTLVHRDKDMTRFAEEMADEGEDEDIEYIDEDEIEDLDDFEYEEEDA